MEGVEAQLGPIDILINAAGISLQQTTSGHALEDWRAVIETNLTGPFLTTRACMPGMIARGWGRIVNIGSTEARTARPSNPQNRLVQPGEIAALVAFACSDAAPALTMEDIQINAGAQW